MHYVSESKLLPSSGEITNFHLKKEAVCFGIVMYFFIIFVTTENFLASAGYVSPVQLLSNS
jgi:hypothetical protein